MLQLVVIAMLRYIMMRYFYQPIHLVNCRYNIANSYFHDEVIYMNEGVLLDPTEPLQSLLHLPPPLFLNIPIEGTAM
jgi:hypothetical protein